MHKKEEEEIANARGGNPRKHLGWFLCEMIHEDIVWWQEVHDTGWWRNGELMDFQFSFMYKRTYIRSFDPCSFVHVRSYMTGSKLQRRVGGHIAFYFSRLSIEHRGRENTQFTFHPKKGVAACDMSPCVKVVLLLLCSEIVI